MKSGTFGPKFISFCCVLVIVIFSTESREVVGNSIDTQLGWKWIISAYRNRKVEIDNDNNHTSDGAKLNGTRPRRLKVWNVSLPAEVVEITILSLFLQDSNASAESGDAFTSSLPGERIFQIEKTGLGSDECVSDSLQTLNANFQNTRAVTLVSLLEELKEVVENCGPSNHTDITMFNTPGVIRATELEEIPVTELIDLEVEIATQITHNNLEQSPKVMLLKRQAVAFENTSEEATAGFQRLSNNGSAILESSIVTSDAINKTVSADNFPSTVNSSTESAVTKTLEKTSSDPSVISTLLTPVSSQDVIVPENLTVISVPNIEENPVSNLESTSVPQNDSSNFSTVGGSTFDFQGTTSGISVTMLTNISNTTTVMDNITQDLSTTTDNTKPSIINAENNTMNATTMPVFLFQNSTESSGIPATSEIVTDFTALNASKVDNGTGVQSQARNISMAGLGVLESLGDLTLPSEVEGFSTSLPNSTTVLFETTTNPQLVSEAPTTSNVPTITATNKIAGARIQDHQNVTDNLTEQSTEFAQGNKTDFISVTGDATINLLNEEITNISKKLAETEFISAITQANNETTSTGVLGESTVSSSNVEIVNTSKSKTNLTENFQAPTPSIKHPPVSPENTTSIKTSLTLEEAMKNRFHKKGYKIRYGSTGIKGSANRHRTTKTKTNRRKFGRNMEDADSEELELLSLEDLENDTSISDNGTEHLDRLSEFKRMMGGFYYENDLNTTTSITTGVEVADICQSAWQCNIKLNERCISDGTRKMCSCGRAFLRNAQTGVCELLSNTTCSNKKPTYCSPNADCISDARNRAGYYCICKNNYLDLSPVISLYPGEECEGGTSCEGYCKNRGVCGTKDGDISCSCALGYSGYRCEYFVLETSLLVTAGIVSASLLCCVLPVVVACCLRRCGRFEVNHKPGSSRSLSLRPVLNRSFSSL